MALISKLGWNLAIKSGKICVSILLSKYHVKIIISWLPSLNQMTLLFGKICKSKELIKLEICYQIRNGESINI